MQATKILLLSEYFISRHPPPSKSFTRYPLYGWHSHSRVEVSTLAAKRGKQAEKPAASSALHTLNNFLSGRAERRAKNLEGSWDWTNLPVLSLHSSSEAWGGPWGNFLSPFKQCGLHLNSRWLSNVQWTADGWINIGYKPSYRHIDDVNFKPPRDSIFTTGLFQAVCTDYTPCLSSQPPDFRSDHEILIITASRTFFW